jgi:hypothetical protein
MWHKVRSTEARCGELEVDDGCRLARRWRDGGTASPRWGSQVDGARRPGRHLVARALIDGTPARVHDVHRGRRRRSVERLWPVGRPFLRSRQDTTWQCGCGGCMAPGGQGPLTGRPRVEETATDKWARSYLISIRNKCQKMNSPREK